MNKPIDYAAAIVSNGYLIHAVDCEAGRQIQVTPGWTNFVGLTLCRRGRNGTRLVLDEEGEPLPFEFNEYHCDRCMGAVSKRRKAKK